MTLLSIRQTGVAGLLALFLAGSLGAQIATRKVLTLEAAKKIAAAAEAEARKNNWNVVIAIVDDGGNLMYLQRLDGTQIASIEIAPFKARGAIGFKRSTKVLADSLAGGATYLLKVPWAAPLEGGVPLVVDGEILGAIGVSGVTSQQDGVVATAGAAAAATMK
jgi:glc operon protein GlcG